MKSPRLPIPGIILGPAPERSDQHGAQRRPEFSRHFWHRLTARWQQKTLATGAQRIQALCARLRDAPTPDSSLPALRAGMIRDGFDSPAAERCMAIVALTIERTLGVTPRANQIMAARAILRGTLAEVPTGEGKTLATALAACVAALAGVPVHVITSNDYLAARDAAQMQPLASALGITIGAVDTEMTQEQRRITYAGAITYCSAKELIFDYLRDRLAIKAEKEGRQPPTPRILRGLCMGIIDEADSILIDEAAVPFILSELDLDPVLGTVCEAAMQIARGMQAGFDFRLDLRTRRVIFTEGGLALIASAPDDGPAIWSIPRYREEMVELALFALHALKINEDYLIKDGKVAIIDSNTGRLALGRAWSRGLHQLVEIKERSAPTPSTRVLAQITFQRFFPRYLLLGGTSGTLTEARRELFETYGLNVLRIPSGRPTSLRIAPPRVAVSARVRWTRVIADIAMQHSQGRPVLVGTDSVRESERLSRLLTTAGIRHAVLNARQDKDEATLVARAGRVGAITVTTNMAGRGTDIVPDPAALAAGGLYVVSCQHNSSRRIDRQLFGRAGRHGQPGNAQAILSLEEGLLGRALPTTLRKCLGLLGGRSGFLPTPLGNILVTLLQRQAENRGRCTRLHMREDNSSQRFRFVETGGE